ncbi:uncharacterized protein METZ01_LOCUS329679, partial [marine metagenome]
EVRACVVEDPQNSKGIRAQAVPEDVISRFE